MFEGRRAEYQAILRLLSMYGLDTPARQYSRPSYRSLCDWLLSDDGFIPWLGNTPIPEVWSQKHSYLKPISNSRESPISRMMIVLQLDGAIQETSILTSSLISSIRGKRAKATDQFVTLGHHHPQPLPLTKAQLMASICRQILIRSPSLFNLIQPLFRRAEKAIRGHNTALKEVVLWKMLRVLLNGKTIGQTFIIIHQPLDVMFSTPFLDLVADIITLAESTEIGCKILVVRKSSTEISKSCPVLQKSISHRDEEVNAALKKDFTLDLGRIAQINPSVISLQAEAVGLLLQDNVDLHSANIYRAMIEQHDILSLELLIRMPLTGPNHDLTSLIFDLIPKAFRPWVQAGLLWMTSAVRPLKRREFEEVLALDSRPGGIIKSSSSAVDEIARFLYGLVEVEADIFYIKNLELCQQLLHHMQEVEEGAPTTYVEDRHHDKLQKEDDSRGGQHNAHIEIALACLAYLTKHQNLYKNEADLDPNNTSSQHLDDNDAALRDTARPTEGNAAPLLPYTVEHWFTHLKLSQNKGALLEVAAIADFLADEYHVNRWVKERASYWTSDQQSVQQTAVPDIKTLAESLDFQTSNASDMAKVVQLVLDASTVDGKAGPGLWASITLAAAQWGNVDALDRLDRKGYLEDEVTLTAVFKTGSESALCSLVQRKAEWIRQNVYEVTHNAVLSGNLNLVHTLLVEFGDSISFTDFETPLIYDVAEDGTAIPSDLLWERLKSEDDLEAKWKTVFHAAACSGHTTLMSRLLSTISEPRVMLNWQDTSGSFALRLAAKNGHFTVVEQLLAAGADVTLSDMDGQTPLHVACAGGYVDTVRALLRYEARIGLKDQEGKTPLHTALENGHQEVCVILLNKLESSPREREAIDIDTKDLGGRTLLHLAVLSNLLVAVKSLLKFGADVNIASEDQSYPLHYAVDFGFDEVLLVLLAAEGIMVNVVDADRATPLHYATRLNYMDVIKILLKHGADGDALNSSGRTPLATACRSGHAAAAKMLLPSVSREHYDLAYWYASGSNSVEALNVMLKAGVNIDSKWEGAGTALHMASYNARPRLVQVLLARRAELEQCDNNGRTPLIDAARQGNPECVRLLVDAGANVDAEDNDGYTSLFYSASGNHQECVRILLEANAELKIKAGMSDIYSQPLDLALHEFNPEVFEIILDHGALPPSPDALRRYLDTEDFDIRNIQILLKPSHDWDPNQEIGSYGTMLHYAALWGKLDLAELLVKSDRVNVNACNKMYGTPLEIAAMRKFTDIVTLLLQKNANVTIGSARYGTPLHVAAYMHTPYEEEDEEKYLAIVREILVHDPSAINVKAGYYMTPLHAAAAHGTVKMLETLLSYHLDLDKQAGCSTTPLHYAAIRGTTKIVELVLAQTSFGLTPETVDAGGRLPVHMAASTNRDHLIEMLTTPSISLLTRDLEGRNSLHFAAGNGNVSFARHIIEQSPEAVHDVDNDSWTPLHWACRQGSTDIVELLLSHKADKYAKTKRDWQPVHVALYHGFMAVANIVKIDEGDLEEPQSALETELVGEQERLHVKKEKLSESSHNRILYYGCDSCYCVSTMPSSANHSN